jgi:hypothetical protein
VFSMPTNLKEVHEELESARAIWELLITLAHKHPVASFLLIFLMILIVGGQLRTGLPFRQTTERDRV